MKSINNAASFKNLGCKILETGVRSPQEKSSLHFVKKTLDEEELSDLPPR